MIWLCIRGALILFLTLGSTIFWVWLLAPAQRGKYGTSEYSQWKMDTFTAMFGGLGLFIATAFVIAVVLSYWQPWKT